MGVEIAGDLDLLKRYAASLERAGRRGAVGEAIWKVIVADVEPLREKARQHAREILPSRNGLADLVAASPMPIVTRTRGRQRGVRIQVFAGAVRDPGRIDRGRLKHPTYGHAPSVLQDVPVGWFSVPVTLEGPRLRAKVRASLDAELRRLQAGGA